MAQYGWPTRKGRHLVKLLADRVPGGRQLGGDVGADADDGGGGAAGSADRRQGRPGIAGAADEDGIVLVDHLHTGMRSIARSGNPAWPELSAVPRHARRGDGLLRASEDL